MATFDSTIPLSYQTSLPLTGSKSLAVFQDLTSHVESFTDDEIVQVGTIVCRPLTTTEKNTVMTFYDDNKSIEFQFVNPHDGGTYTLTFLSPPPTPVKLETLIDHFMVVLTVTGSKNA